MMEALPNADLLFKAQSLPPLMLRFTVGELMGSISEFLQSKYEMFHQVNCAGDKPSGPCRHDVPVFSCLQRK